MFQRILLSLCLYFMLNLKYEWFLKTSYVFYFYFIIYDVQNINKYYLIHFPINPVNTNLCKKSFNFCTHVYGKWLAYGSFSFQKQLSKHLYYFFMIHCFYLVNILFCQHDLITRNMNVLKNEFVTIIISLGIKSFLLNMYFLFWKWKHFLKNIKLRFFNGFWRISLYVLCSI